MQRADPVPAPATFAELAVDGAVVEVPNWSTDELRARSERAFTSGAHRLEVRIDLANVAIAALALAGGFGYEGRRRGALGAGRDLAVFARTAEDPGTPIAPAFPALPMDGLSDTTIALRVAGPADADAVREQDADPTTIAFGFQTSPPPAAEVERMLAGAGLDRLVGPGMLCAIVDTTSGRCAGTIRIRATGLPQVAIIGYGVHPAFRGRGYTTRALRLLSTWAFARTSLVRLELGARVDNVASQRAALAAGFEPEGLMRGRLRAPDGTFRDEARFSLLRP